MNPNRQVLILFIWFGGLFWDMFSDDPVTFFIFDVFTMWLNLVNLVSMVNVMFGGAVTG